MLGWKIGLKGYKRSNGSTDAWKHPFYQDDKSIICFGIPVEKLPDEIKDIINEMRSTASCENAKGGDVNG